MQNWSCSLEAGLLSYCHMTTLQQTMKQIDNISREMPVHQCTIDQATLFLVLHLCGIDTMIGKIVLLFNVKMTTLDPGKLKWQEVV